MIAADLVVRPVLAALAVYPHSELAGDSGCPDWADSAAYPLDYTIDTISVITDTGGVYVTTLVGPITRHLQHTS